MMTRKADGMFGLSLDRWFSIANTVYILAVAVAAVATFAIFQLSQSISSRDGVEKEALRNQVELAKSEAAKANERAAVANERAAELKLTLEREITARQPRTISSQQRAEILQRLSSDISPKTEIAVVWKLFDEEAEQFGKQILSLLKEAGFETKEVRGPFGFSVAGQWIVVSDLAKLTSAPTAIGAVQSAFREVLHAQFDGTQRDASWPNMGDIVIAIGAKSYAP